MNPTKKKFDWAALAVIVLAVLLVVLVITDIRQPAKALWSLPPLRS